MALLQYIGELLADDDIFTVAYKRNQSNSSFDIILF